MPTEAQIRVTAGGMAQAEAGFKRLNRGIAGLGTTAGQTTRKMQAGFGAVQSKLTGLVGMLVGGGLVAGTKRILDWSTGLGKLQAKAMMTTPQIKALGAQLIELSKATGISKDELLAGVMVAQDFGGVTKELMAILPGLARASKATSSSMTDLSTVASALFSGGMEGADVLDVVATLSSQADAATVSMEGLSKVIANVSKVGATMGPLYKGAAGVKRIGAAMQVVGGGFAGDPEQSRTTLIALMSDMVTKQKKLRKMGIDVKGSGGRGLGDITDIMEALYKKTGGDATKLAGIFGRESQAGVGAYFEAFAQRGSGTRGDVLGALAGAGAGKVEEQYKLRMSGIAAEAVRVERSMTSLDAALEKYGGALVSKVAESPGKAVAIAGGAAVTWKLLPHLIGAGVTAFRGRKGVPGMGGGVGGMGGLAGAVGHGGVQAVYVVNMPGANIGQAAGFGFGGHGAPASAPVAKPAFGTGMTGMEKASVVGASFGAGLAAGNFIDEIVKEATGKELNEHIALNIGGAPESGAAAIARAQLAGGERTQRLADAQAVAEKYFKMREAGVSLQGPGGQRTALSEGVIAQRIQAETGVSFSSAEMTSLLRRIAKGVEKNQILKFTNFLGLSDPTVAAGRGPGAGS
jgi:TP901 family phage tail tape measure protein